MKKIILAALAMGALSGCGMMTQSSTKTAWACYQSMPGYHKDKKPDDNCGLCDPMVRNGGECVPAPYIYGYNPAPTANPQVPPAKRR